MTPPTQQPELVAESYPRPRPAWIERVTSADHKSVGVLYIATALTFAVLALTELVLMRLQLIASEATLIRPEIFDRLLSAYGATALVLFAIPLALGLISYVVPLQIGARGTALPRVGLLSWWLYLAGGVTLYASFLYSPSEAGSTALPPLSGTEFLVSNGVDAWSAGIALALLGFVLFAVNMVVTLRRMRAPGMAYRRMPLFSWAALASSYLLLVIGPVMIAALSMLVIDRHYDGIFFDPAAGGSPIFYQHLSWIFFSGAYALAIVPFFGAISEIVAAFAHKPVFAHRATAGALVAVAALIPLAWMQNMYTAPIPVGFQYFAMLVALALIVPFGIIAANWAGTLWRGSIELRLPMLFALGAISTATLGLVGEWMQSVIPVGGQLTDTGVAWGDTHYALLGSSVFGGLAALFYWLPKLSGRIASEGLGRGGFWAMLVGVHLMVLPIQLAGLEGQPVDVYKFFGGEGRGALNLISTLGTLVFAGGFGAALVAFARGATGGAKVGADPWRGDTLEWFAPSPPPPHNFDLVPDVRGPEPLREIRAAVERRAAALASPGSATAATNGESVGTEAAEPKTAASTAAETDDGEGESAAPEPPVA